MIFLSINIYALKKYWLHYVVFLRNLAINVLVTVCLPFPSLLTAKGARLSLSLVIVCLSSFLCVHF